QFVRTPKEKRKIPSAPTPLITLPQSPRPLASHAPSPSLPSTASSGACRQPRRRDHSDCVTHRLLPPRLRAHNHPTVQIRCAIPALEGRAPHLFGGWRLGRFELAESAARVAPAGRRTCVDRPQFLRDKSQDGSRHHTVSVFVVEAMFGGMRQLKRSSR
uniref:Uncharacterized protein n=1 Tax=Triticum urartu TaxID=4572 RepID=A0A8R7TWA2_TRIUA